MKLNSQPDWPSSPPQDLEGRVAVVTGGGRGLGKEVSLAFAAHGASVVIASRNLATCATTAEQITATTGRPILPVACHVGRWTDCDRLIETVMDRFGTIDILVNNAGMSPLYSSPDAISEELFDKVIAVNLKGAFRLMSVVGAQMARSDGGSIINISSVAAVRPSPTELPYAAAKAGLNCLTRGLARALGPKVRVNAIVAGPFLTDISASWDNEAFSTTAAGMPLGRAGQPAEITGAALFLAGDASSFTTGATIAVDGGYLCCPG